MSRTGVGTERIAAPLRAFGRRLSFLFLLSLATALLVLGRAENYIVKQAQILVVDVVAPVMDVIARPVENVSNVITNAQDIWDVHQENLVLRAELEKLRSWQSVAHKLDQENRNLRDLLNVEPGAHMTYITARIIGDSGGAYVRTFLVNAGTLSGVKDGQAAINGQGLVGRIVDAGRQASRLLLLTDLNSRVPIVIEKTRFRGVLAGGNNDFPRIEFLPPEAKVAPGDTVVTSGHGGMLPAGLRVGVVRSVEDGVIEVQPMVAYNRLEFLRILKFGSKADMDVSSKVTDAIPAQTAGGEGEVAQ